jgi:neutral ceramidase
MIVGSLTAGMATKPLHPVGEADLVGYLRRARPAERHGQPLEVGVLVIDDGTSKAVVISLDILGVPAVWASELRQAAADVAGCQPANVLVNASHTHAAPPPPVLRKLGGKLERRTSELQYVDAVVGAVAELTRNALDQAVPVVAMASKGHWSGLVNRRQRLADGRMALGHNPHGPTDDSVNVIAFDTPEGQPVATVVSVACHPIVIGPDVDETSSDFVGPLRSKIREWTGAACMFLQGCGGNMMPLYAMFDHVGPEEALGSSIALEALKARESAQSERAVPRMESVYNSAVPFALWRPSYSPTPDRASIRVEATAVTLPLSPMPSIAEIGDIKNELADRLCTLEEAGEPEEVLNPIRIHLDWATESEAQIRNGDAAEVETSVQLLSIGGLSIYGLPGEAFCEIGMEIADRSPAGFPMVLGYTNDGVGYLATDREMLRGGYEPALSQRHYCRPAPFGPGSADALVRAALSMD